VHANLLIAANVRICSLKFSVKKINAIIFGPPWAAGPPHCGVSSYATDMVVDNKMLLLSYMCTLGMYFGKLLFEFYRPREVLFQRLLRVKENSSESFMKMSGAVHSVNDR